MKHLLIDYALGALAPADRAAVDEDRRHDPALDVAANDLEESLAPLSLAAGSCSPPAGLWARIDAALDQQAEAMAGRTLLAYGEGVWEPMVEGVECKWLWNERTKLIRCRPGAEMPSHDHDDREHLLVISGDLIIGGRTFLAGDYVGSRQGHDRFLHTTRTGCLILSQMGS